MGRQQHGDPARARHAGAHRGRSAPANRRISCGYPARWRAGGPPGTHHRWRPGGCQLALGQRARRANSGRRQHPPAAPGRSLDLARRRRAGRHPQGTAAPGRRLVLAGTARMATARHAGCQRRAVWHPQRAPMARQPGRPGPGHALSRGRH